MKTLPVAFMEAMKKRLGDEYASFLDSYQEMPEAGIRINTLKMNLNESHSIIPHLGERIPWTPDGYYTLPDARPGKHPLYHAGFYYIQEPSAMAPVHLLDVKTGDRVLDLCAAPGGKSVQIAASIGREGVLITNDIHPDRTKALTRNMELYGVKRAVVLNERPERIAEAFPQWFNKVLVDAPCSGEGMFRKDPDMVRAWEREPVLTYAKMQQEILDSAAEMVKPGGRLVYSTCTFSPEENEASIARFLTKHPQFKVVPIELKHGFAAGRSDWAEACMQDHGWEAAPEAIAQVAGTARLWPHRVKGEGHYAAVLERSGDCGESLALNEDVEHVRLQAARNIIAEEPKLRRKDQQLDKRGGKRAKLQDAHPAQSRPRGLRDPEQDQKECFTAFCQSQLIRMVAAPNAAMGDYLYECPIPLGMISNLRVVRPGWFLGTCKNNRFEPSQALALGLHKGESAQEYRLNIDDPDVLPYLRGDTLQIREELMFADDLKAGKGYVLVMLEGSPLGWAKRVDYILKNEYPAAWRWT